MRRGIKVLIVAVVALGTNFGLHAAFGWCRPNHWNHHGHYRYHNECDHYGNHHMHNGDANSWNCTWKNESSDTLDRQ